MSNDMSVSYGVFEFHPRLLTGCFFVQQGRLDIAIAIPNCLAILQFNAMDHAACQKPVLTDTGRRIGTVSKISAVELRRNTAGNLQIEISGFFKNRGKISRQPKWRLLH